MRNQASMLYSSFWYSCTFSKELPMKLQLKGPDLFHNLVKSDIERFNQCMRDSSTPSLSQACTLDRGRNYSTCILQRLSLLSKCTQESEAGKHYAFNSLKCGRAKISHGMYYEAIYKWLSIISRSRFLFLTLEELVGNPTLAARHILEFLSLNTDIAADKDTIMKI